MASHHDITKQMNRAEWLWRDAQDALKLEDLNKTREKLAFFHVELDKLQRLLDE